MSDRPGESEAEASDGNQLANREAESLTEEVVSEVLEGVAIDEATRERLTANIEMVIGQVQSPLPPPFMLRDYQAILPDAPERIFAMAESQTAHRQMLEASVVNGGNRRAYIGQVFGLIVALAFGYWAYSLIMNDHGIAGGILGTLDLVALVGVFVLGRDRQVSSVEVHRAQTEE